MHVKMQPPRSLQKKSAAVQVKSPVGAHASTLGKEKRVSVFLTPVESALTQLKAETFQAGPGSKQPN